MANRTAVSSDALSVGLNSLLQQEIGLTRQLLQLIGEEKAQLEAPLASDINAMLEQKVALLQQLQQTSAERQTLMQQHGYDNTAQGVEFCCLACAHAPDIRQGFNQLAELARECHSANQILGQLINRKSVFFGQLLSRLGNSEQPQLYQANGMTDPAAVVNLRNRVSV